MPPAAMGVNVVTGTGTRSPKCACAAMPSDVRSCGLARMRVLVFVSSRRTSRLVGLARKRLDPLRRPISSTDRPRPSVPSPRAALAGAEVRVPAGGGETETVLPQGLAVHLEQLHLDHDLGARLVDGPDQPGRRVDAFRSVLDRDGVGGGHRRQPPHVHHQAQQVDGLVHVRAAEIEGPDDLFLVLAALRRRVGDDGDGAGRGHPEEVAGAGGDRGERRVERHAAQVPRERRVAELCVEDDADAAELSQGREHRARALAAEDDRGGELDALRQVEPGRRRRESPLDERLERGLSVRVGSQLRAHGFPRLADRAIEIAHPRVQVVRDLEFFQRLLPLRQPCQPPSLREVHLRRPQSGAIEGELRVAVVRPLLQRAGVGDYRLIVVARALGALPLPQGAGGRAGRRRQGQRDEEHPGVQARPASGQGGHH